MLNTVDTCRTKHRTDFLFFLLDCVVEDHEGGILLYHTSYKGLFDFITVRSYNVTNDHLRNDDD